MRELSGHKESGSQIHWLLPWVLEGKDENRLVLYSGTQRLASLEGLLEVLLWYRKDRENVVAASDGDRRSQISCLVDAERGLGLGQATYTIVI